MKQLDLNVLSANLRYAMESAGYTIGTLSESTGLHKNTLHGIMPVKFGKTPRMPSVYTLLIIADACNTTISELLEDCYVER